MLLTCCGGCARQREDGVCYKMTAGRWNFFRPAEFREPDPGSAHEVSPRLSGLLA
jgi:hypothetical protein